MSRKLVIFVCTLCLVSMAMTARADIISTNGDFETGDTTGWWSYLPVTGNQTFTVVPAGYAGSWSGQVTNTGSGPQADLSVGQGKFAGVVAGTTYTVDAAFKQTIVTTGDGWTGGGIGVEFYGTEDSGSYISGTFWNFWGSDWETYSIPMVAPVGANYVQVKVDSWLGGTPDESTASYTLGLDNVTLTGTLIPEPATMVLLGIGGLVALRRKHA